jgi:hypothetical protein
MKKSDVILLSAILLCAAAIFGVSSFIFLGNGAQVVVRVDGEEYARLPLHKDDELLINGVNGTNLLIIKDGKAYINEASCPDLICVHTGYANELKSIVCLPNRVTISIEK